MSATAALVTSRDNPRIRAARVLLSRSERDRTGTFLVEGARFLHRALDSKADVRQAIVAPELLVPGEQALVAQLRSLGVAVVEASARVFGTLSRAVEPTGLATVVAQQWLATNDAVPGLWAAAVEIGTPGNLGTLVRTCEAAGSGLFVVGDSTDPYDPAAVRASMGSVFGVPLVRASWREVVNWCRRTRTPLIGTSPRGATPYRETDVARDVVLAFGSEASGLTEGQLLDCAQVLRIPMPRRLDSLNVGVAAGIVLFEAVHQREAPNSASAAARHRRTNSPLPAM
jgi:TrmH family RNA methyltransferase